MIQVSLNRVQGDYGFEAKDAQGHIIKTDSSLENGGENFGARPMQLLLMGLGSCSAIDVVSILKKQRQGIEAFSIDIKGEREQGKEPSLWKTIYMAFELRGDIDEDKAKRACALSIDKYCSVAETLRRAGAEIKWEVKITAPVS